MLEATINIDTSRHLSDIAYIYLGIEKADQWHEWLSIDGFVCGQYIDLRDLAEDYIIIVRRLAQEIEPCWHYHHIFLFNSRFNNNLIQYSQTSRCRPHLKTSAL